MAERIFTYLKAAAPTVNDDTGDGYFVGDMWLDETNDVIYQAIDVTAGAAVWKNLSGYVAPVQGGLFNGYISRSVASNNLTVAIKTLAGADPSATDPVYVRIGNTVRKLTAALSVTKAAGTNWCNAGGAELATIEQDYFVYLGYNATDGTVIGFSRYPGARVYGDFSATTTNEKYAGISTITTAGATDEYEVIGRFNATLSAGAGYTWSVPATDITISRPTHETRWLTWTPTLAGWSANPTVGARYRVEHSTLHWIFHSTAAGTSNAVTSTATLPWTAINDVSAYWTTGRGNDNAAEVTSTFRILPNTATLDAYRGPGNTAWTAAGNKYFSGEGFYRI